MIVDLDEWRTRFTLEALQTLDDKWKATIAAAAKKGDDNAAAEYANDLAMLRTLREGFEANAVEAFGPSVACLSREPIILASPAQNGDRTSPR
jgi:hypothetical protein